MTLSSLLVTSPFGPCVREKLSETRRSCQLPKSELDAGELWAVLERRHCGCRSGEGCLAENACLPRAAVPWISWSREICVLLAPEYWLGPGIGDDLRDTWRTGSMSGSLVTLVSLVEETVSSSSTRLSSGSDSLASNANGLELLLEKLWVGVSWASSLIDPTVCFLTSTSERHVTDSESVKLSIRSLSGVVCPELGTGCLLYTSPSPRDRG